MSKSIRVKRQKVKKRAERNRIRLKHGKKPAGKKRLRLGLASKYGYRQGTIIDYNERQEIERLHKKPAVCGWIRNYGRIGSGKISGVCALSEQFGQENSYGKINRCVDNVPMKDHRACDVFQYFMRTSDNPDRVPFFIYPVGRGHYEMRFFWEGKEIAGNLLIEGKTRPRIKDLGIGGFCENLQLIKGRIVEDITPPDFQDGLELRQYLSKNREGILEGLRSLLTNEECHSIREQRSFVLPSFTYQEGRDKYKLRFDWRGKEVVCSVYLGGRKNKHLDKIFIEGFCQKMEVEDGKILEYIVPVRKEDRWDLKHFLWDPPEHIYEGLRAVLPSGAYDSLRRSDSLKSKVKYGKKVA